MESEIKICNKCGEEKTLDEYPLDNSKKGGRKGICRDCHNDYLRNLRASKSLGANVKSGSKSLPNVPKIIPESEVFEKELIEFAKKFKTMDELDMDFVLTIPEKIIKFHEEAKYPPTNKFKICDLLIRGGGDPMMNVSIIRSRLTLFLMQKQKKNPSEINITKDKKYYENSLLVITLPKDILLSHSEIEEFNKSILSRQEEKKVHIIEIVEEGVDLSPVTKEIPNIIYDFLRKKCACVVDPFDVLIRYRNQDHVVISWPEEHAIPIQCVEKLREVIFGYILASL